MRNNLTKTIFVDTKEEMDKYLFDPTIECRPPEPILETDELDDQVFLITYKYHEEFVEENKYSNIFIALYTTSEARLELWKALKKVSETPNCEILYFDVCFILFYIFLKLLD